MSIVLAVVLLFVVVVLGFSLWGLFNERPSTLVAVVASGTALLAALLSWYSAVESQSVGFAVGYGVAALLCVVSAVRQVVRSGRNASDEV